MADALAAAASIGDSLAWGGSVLGAAGCDTPRLDAELLLCEALDVGRERLVIDRDIPVAAEAAERFAALAARRMRREPVAYILGRRAFRRLELRVDPRVLIPRPETERLVEVGLSLASGASVLDVGTGSGAVALALKDERPDLIVSGVDVSVGAVDVAHGNASRLGLDVTFAIGDLLEGRPAVDVVLANLPYVETDAELPADIARYEPPGALFAGADGLDLVRRLVEAATLRRPQLLALELAPSQACQVAGLVRGAGFAQVEVLRDLAGRDRVVVGRS